MLTLSIFGILSCFIECSLSQADASSFGIFASSDSVSTTSSSIRLTLSWNTEQWECIINETISEPVEYYMCTSGDFEPNATLITDTLPSNTYEMKVELIGQYTENDLIRIEAIRVSDDDSNYYDIDTFCLPPPFQQTTARGTTSERLECCYWSQKYSYNNYAMGTALKISYVQFRSNVLDRPNEAHEGAVKPPMITELGITTLDIDGAESSSEYLLTLHWDSQQYAWTVQPDQRNKTFITTFSDSDAFCEFSSRFSLEIAASFDDSLGIDTIIIRDEAGNYYNIDMFCPSTQIGEWHRYNNSNKQCDDGPRWSQYAMYYGFIYNGTDTLYIQMNNALFLNANEKQQGLILQSVLQYRCDAIQDEHKTKEFTLFKDNMSDPLFTGWIFDGTYRESMNTVNCPGGSTNKCSRLAGHEATTTLDSSMEITINASTSNYVSVQYNLALSAVPTGKRCYVYYAFDGGSFSVGKSHTSTGVALQTYSNQSFTIAIDTELEFKSITIRFVNQALYDSEYCYMDEFYVFLGDIALEIDRCEAWDSSWTYYGAGITATDCPSSCIWVYSLSSYWARKSYDITKYNNLMLVADFMVREYSGSVYYSYDNEAESLLATIPAGSSSYTSRPKQKFNIPDAIICGASVLYVRFQCRYLHIDNVMLFGHILETSAPTVSPTTDPTKYPTLQTFNPSSYPTMGPSMVPTANPTMVPTNDPTDDPTMSPSNDPTKHPTQYPTKHPTQYPTKNPSNPTKYPTVIPTIYPTNNPSFDPTVDPSFDPTIDPTVIPTIHPTQYPTKYPTIYPTNNPSFDPTIDPTVIPTIYPSIYPTQYPTIYPSIYPTIYPTNNPSFDPTIDPTLAPTVESTATPSVDPSFPSQEPTKYPIRNDVSIESIESTLVISQRDDAANTNESVQRNTFLIIFIVVAIVLLLLLVFVKMYTLYQNRASIHDMNEHRGNKGEGNDMDLHDNNVNDMAVNVEGNELEMTQANNGDDLGNDDGKEMENMLGRQGEINVWFEKHVKLKQSNQKYYNLFILNGYDELSLIAEITNSDLIEMGVDKMAHRNRIIRAVQMLTS